MFVFSVARGRTVMNPSLAVLFLRGLHLMFIIFLNDHFFGYVTQLLVSFSSYIPSALHLQAELAL